MQDRTDPLLDLTDIDQHPSLWIDVAGENEEGDIISASSITRGSFRAENGAVLLTRPTHTQPTFAALMAGEFLVHSGEGAAYSEEEGCGWLHESHWQPLKRIPLAGPASLIVAQTA